MKKTFILLVIMLGFITLGTAQNKSNNAAPGAKIEVMYFHATNRCPTCLAVENNAKKTIEQNFKSELKNGKIKFVSLNIDDKANKAIVDKYEVVFSTLLIIKKAGARETKTDFTDNAFQYARSNPAKYSELLIAEIRKNL